MVSEGRGLLKLRTSFSYAREPIFLLKDLLTLLGVPVAPPAALYWLFDLMLLSFIINYIMQRSHQYAESATLALLCARRAFNLMENLRARLCFCLFRFVLVALPVCHLLPESAD